MWPGITATRRSAANNRPDGEVADAAYANRGIRGAQLIGSSITLGVIECGGLRFDC
jgi:hypothetical protein